MMSWNDRIGTTVSPCHGKKNRPEADTFPAGLFSSCWAWMRQKQVDPAQHCGKERTLHISARGQYRHNANHSYYTPGLRPSSPFFLESGSPFSSGGYPRYFLAVEWSPLSVLHPQALVFQKIQILVDNVEVGILLV
jgi:hypothetical protein